MNTKYKDGKIEFDFNDLLDRMDTEGKLAMIENLACENDIIDHVTAQIIDGWTENGSYGSISCTASENPYFGLDKAWRDVSRKADVVAQREISRLEKALKYKGESLQEANESNAQLRAALDQYRRW